MGTQPAVCATCSAAAGGGVRAQRGAARLFGRLLGSGGQRGVLPAVTCMGLEHLLHRGGRGRRRRCILVRHVAVDRLPVDGRAGREMGEAARGRHGQAVARVLAAADLVGVAAGAGRWVSCGGGGGGGVGARGSC